MSRPDLPATTLGDVLSTARARLPEPREATLLVAAALGLSRETLYAHPERPISPDESKRALAWIDERAAGTPVAYLTGRREFYGLTLDIGPAALIPRPETELIVELALAEVDNLTAPRIADLGTGSGAIALAIGHERPDAHIIATDRSADALKIASGNATRLALGNIAFKQGDWFEPLGDERFDLIVSNPPYVASADPHLDQGDLRFEPQAALSSGADGLNAIRTIAAGARAHLKPGGALILEHGFEQQPAIRDLLTEHGYTDIQTYRDLAGQPRAVSCRTP